MRTYPHTCVIIYTHVHVHLCLRIYVCMYVYVCMNVRIRTFMYTFIRFCTFHDVYLQGICTHLYMYTHICSMYMHVYFHVRTCTCMYACVRQCTFNTPFQAKWLVVDCYTNFCVIRVKIATAKNNLCFTWKNPYSHMTSLQWRIWHAVITMVLLYNFGARNVAAMAKFSCLWNTFYLSQLKGGITSPTWHT